MEFNYMTGALEAILFASGEPIEREKLAQTCTLSKMSFTV